MTENTGENGNGSKTEMVGCRYPMDRIHLLDAVKARWGSSHRSDVVKVALNRLLVDEGLLSGEAAA